MIELENSNSQEDVQNCPQIIHMVNYFAQLKLIKQKKTKQRQEAKMAEQKIIQLNRKSYQKPQNNQQILHNFNEIMHVKKLQREKIQQYQKVPYEIKNIQNQEQIKQQSIRAISNKNVQQQSQGKCQNFLQGDNLPLLENCLCPQKYRDEQQLINREKETNVQNQKCQQKQLKRVQPRLILSVLKFFLFVVVVCLLASFYSEIINSCTSMAHFFTRRQYLIRPLTIKAPAIKVNHLLQNLQHKRKKQLWTVLKQQIILAAIIDSQEQQNLIGQINQQNIKYYHEASKQRINFDQQNFILKG